MASTPEDKRQFPRIKISNPLRYQVRGKEAFSNGICNNISAGGLALVSESFIPRATPVMLEINVLSRVLNPIGRVSWATSMPHSDRYRMGVEFLEINPRDRQYLSDYVNLQLNRL